MIGRALRVALEAALFVAGVAAGRQHERTHAFGTAYWRAQAELALHLYDEPRLISIQAQLPPAYRGRHRVEQALAFSMRTFDAGRGRVERAIEARFRAVHPSPRT